MSYSSSLSDKEWEIIEPLLPRKQKTRPPIWTKRQILDGIFYQLKNGCNWCDLPKDLPPYSTVFWHYKQWRSDGVLAQIMTTLHSQVRQQAQKNHNGQGCCSSTHKRWKTLAMPVFNPRGFATTNAPMASNAIWQLIRWGSRFSPPVLLPMCRMTKV